MNASRMPNAVAWLWLWLARSLSLSLSPSLSLDIYIYIWAYIYILISLYLCKKGGLHSIVISDGGRGGDGWDGMRWMKGRTEVCMYVRMYVRM